MPVKKAASKKRKSTPARKKTASKKAAAKKTAAKRKTASKKKAPARKSVAKKKVSKKKASKKKPATRKKAAKKVSKKKPAARKKPTKKVSKKKPATKKKAAKKVSKKKPAAKKKPTKKISKKKPAAKKVTKKKPAARKKAPSKKKAVSKKRVPSVKKAAVKKRVPKREPVARKTQPARTRSRRDVMSGPIHGIAPYNPKRGEEYMSDAQIEHFRKILSAWKRELIFEVDRTVHHMQDEAANFPDPNDRATQESEFGLELRTRDRERKLLRKIESALARLDDGSYGFCDETGEEIGLKRLEARPVATLCLEAQERRELAERQFRDLDDRYR